MICHSGVLFQLHHSPSLQNETGSAGNEDELKLFTWWLETKNRIKSRLHTTEAAYTKCQRPVMI